MTEAEQFFVAYKGVWEDYPVKHIQHSNVLCLEKKTDDFNLQAHIKHFTSGPAVALSVDTDVNTFREFVGPCDPVILFNRIQI